MKSGIRLWAVGCVTGAALCGCASEGPRPTAELTRASTLIDQAEQSGAQRYAGAELAQARDKLGLANAAADKGKQELAARLATEATADAQLAAARTASAQAEQAAQEVHRSTETLREEANRSSSPAGSNNETLPPPDSSTPH